MAKIFRKTHNPYVICAVTHSLTLRGLGLEMRDGGKDGMERLRGEGRLNVKYLVLFEVGGKSREGQNLQNVLQVFANLEHRPNSLAQINIVLMYI